jgi:hypothetical protein
VGYSRSVLATRSHCEAPLLEKGEMMGADHELLMGSKDVFSRDFCLSRIRDNERFHQVAAHATGGDRSRDFPLAYLNGPGELAIVPRGERCHRFRDCAGGR